jgi:hypothetical protein
MRQRTDWARIQINRDNWWAKRTPAQWREWVARGCGAPPHLIWTHMLTLQLAQGMKLPAARKILARWCQQMDRANLGKRFQQYPDQRLWLVATLEQLSEDAHWHCVLRFRDNKCPGVRVEILQEQCLWTIRRLVPGSDCLLEEINPHHQDRVQSQREQRAHYLRRDIHKPGWSLTLSSQRQMLAETPGEKGIQQGAGLLTQRIVADYLFKHLWQHEHLTDWIVLSSQFWASEPTNSAGRGSVKPSQGSVK